MMHVYVIYIDMHVSSCIEEISSATSAVQTPLGSKHQLSMPSTPFGSDASLSSMSARMAEEETKNKELSMKIQLLEQQLSQKQVAPAAPVATAETQATQKLLELAMQRMEKMEEMINSQRQVPVPSQPATPVDMPKPRRKEPEPEESFGYQDSSDEESEDSATMRTPTGEIAPLRDNLYIYTFWNIEWYIWRTLILSICQSSLIYMCWYTNHVWPCMTSLFCSGTNLSRCTQDALQEDVWTQKQREDPCQPGTPRAVQTGRGGQRAVRDGNAWVHCQTWSVSQSFQPDQGLAGHGCM